MTKPRGAGRPTGAKTQEHTVVDVLPAACFRCGSTKRTPYTSTETIDTHGERNGQHYNLVTLRRTSCQDCGQHRIERSFEYRPPGSSKAA